MCLWTRHAWHACMLTHALSAVGLFRISVPLKAPCRRHPHVSGFTARLSRDGGTGVTEAWSRRCRQEVGTPRGGGSGRRRVFAERSSHRGDQHRDRFCDTERSVPGDGEVRGGSCAATAATAASSLGAQSGGSATGSHRRRNCVRMGVSGAPHPDRSICWVVGSREMRDLPPTRN